MLVGGACRAGVFIAVEGTVGDLVWSHTLVFQVNRHLDLPLDAGVEFCLIIKEALSFTLNTREKVGSWVVACFAHGTDYGVVQIFWDSDLVTISDRGIA